MLERTRSSKSSPYNKKKKNSKSYSLVSDDSSKKYKTSSREINITNIEYGLKTPEWYYIDNECCKKVKNDNFILQQKIVALRNEFDLQKNQLKKQFEFEKKSDIDAISKFYLEKIMKYEEKFARRFATHIEKEKEKIKVKYAAELEEKIQEALQVKQKELNTIQEQFWSILKIKEATESSNNKCKSFKSSYENNIQELENKFKIILETKNSEYERKIQMQIQESNLLRRDNIHLTQKVLELQSRIEAQSLTASDKDSESTYIISLNKRYNELFQAYNLLKLKQEELIKTSEPSYCIKCRAFLDTNAELSEKILRLREFLST